MKRGKTEIGNNNGGEESRGLGRAEKIGRGEMDPQPTPPKSGVIQKASRGEEWNAHKNWCEDGGSNLGWDTQDTQACNLGYTVLLIGIHSYVDRETQFCR